MTISKLEIPRGILESLAGVPAELLWKARGLSMHEPDESAGEVYQATFQRALQDLAQSQAGQSCLDNFSEAVRAVFADLESGDFESVRRFTEGRELYFVIGHGRSGGTYLASELSSLLENPIEKYSFLVAHDDYFDSHALILKQDDPNVKKTLEFQPRTEFKLARKEYSEHWIESVLLDKGVIEILDLLNAKGLQLSAPEIF